MKCEVKAIEKYRKPKYPIKEEVAENPELLKYIPNRWKGKQYISALLLSSLLMLTGCNQKNVSEDDHGTKKVTAKENNETKKLVKDDPLNIPKTGGGSWSYYTYDQADLGQKYDFSNDWKRPEMTVVNENAKDNLTVIENTSSFELLSGNGIASFGCVSVAAPVYLTEDEAYQVIADELKEYGIKFDKNSKMIENKVPVYTSSLGSNFKLKKQQIELDGYSEEGRVGFEFISLDDVEKEEGAVISTVESWDMQLTASTMAKNADNEDNGYIGYFYDPVCFGEDKEVSIQILKQQILEFINWLKGQQVI